MGTWKPPHKGDRKADTQREDEQEMAALLPHEKLEHVALGYLEEMV